MAKVPPSKASRLLAGLRRSMPFAIAAVAGVYGGQTTVAAFRADYRETVAAEPSCGQGCSEVDRGYRWAEARDVRAVTDCFDASWSFRRGCMAYLREQGLLAPMPEAVGPVRYAAYRPTKRAAEEEDRPFDGPVLALPSSAGPSDREAIANTSFGKGPLPAIIPVALPDLRSMLQPIPL